MCGLYFRGRNNLMMKKLIAFPISYILYYAGDLISKPMYAYDSFAWLYPAYKNLMYLSSVVQDWANLDGPWKEINEDETESK